jgi:hypothetical protein
MRFRLRTLLLATALAGILLGLGGWQPLLVGFLVLMIAPLVICFWRYWDRPAQLMLCTAALCAFVAAGWGVSYVRPREVKLWIHGRTYQLAFHHGRIIAVHGDSRALYRNDRSVQFAVDGWITVDHLPPMQSEFAGFESFRGKHWENGWIGGWTSYPPPMFPITVFCFRFAHVFLFYLTALFARCAVILAWRSERHGANTYRRLVDTRRGCVNWSV